MGLTATRVAVGMHAAKSVLSTRVKGGGSGIDSGSTLHQLLVVKQKQKELKPSVSRKKKWVILIFKLVSHVFF